MRDSAHLKSRRRELKVCVPKHHAPCFECSGNMLPMAMLAWPMMLNRVRLIGVIATTDLRVHCWSHVLQNESLLPPLTHPMHAQSHGLCNWESIQHFNDGMVLCTPETIAQSHLLIQVPLRRFDGFHILCCGLVFFIRVQKLHEHCRSRLPRNRLFNTA